MKSRRERKWGVVIPSSIERERERERAYSSCSKAEESGEKILE